MRQTSVKRITLSPYVTNEIRTDVVCPNEKESHKVYKHFIYYRLSPFRLRQRLTEIFRRC